MKQFILYTQDGGGLSAFIDMANPEGQYGRLFYSHDGENWTLVLNGVTGITENGAVVNVPASIVTDVSISYLFIEMSNDNVNYWKAADGLVKIKPVIPTGGAVATGSVVVDNFPTVYPLSSSQYNSLLSELQTIASNTMGGGVASTVALDAPTLAALEHVIVAFEAGQIVGLDSATLAALENIVVTGTVNLDPATLAALESVTATVSGTVELGATTLAALESVNAIVSGSVDVDNIPLDAFRNLVIGERDNQIEVHFDDSNYSNYLTTIIVNGGSATYGNGQVVYSTGANVNGGIKATSLDVVKYRPLHESYAAWTAAFKNAGAAGSWQRVGMFTATDGVFLGYEGDTFGLTWRNNGVDTFVPRSSWNDKCDGTTGSKFTRNGVPENLDTTKLNVWRMRFGWLGAAGFVLEVFTPDWEWIPVYQLKRPNTSDVGFLANADLPMAIDIGKSAGGATNYQVATNCWAAGTTSSKGRLSDTITERSLVENVRSVITGKTTGGGGGYVDVKVNPSGALVTDATGSTVGVTATDLDIRNLSVLLDSVTQTLRPSTPYSQPVVGPVTDQVLVAVNPGQRIRLIRNAGHIDPTAVDVYPNITLKIGSTTVFRDKMEPGLPWSETVCFEGVDGADLTISIDAAVSVYLNMRYEVF